MSSIARSGEACDEEGSEILDDAQQRGDGDPRGRLISAARTFSFIVPPAILSGSGADVRLVSQCFDVVLWVWAARP